MILPKSKPSYMQNLKGTIRKVRGADPLPVLDPTEQRNKQFKQGAFVALRVGFSKRVHAERIVEQVHAFRAQQQQNATLSIVTPPNEAQQIAVITDIKAEQLPALNAILQQVTGEEPKP